MKNLKKEIYVGIVFFLVIVLVASNLNSIKNKNTSLRVNDDPELIAAKQEAQNKLPLFIDKFSNNTNPELSFSVKTQFSYNGQVEHMWISVAKIKDNVFIGNLDVDPVWIKNLKQNDIVSVKAEDIEDWIIFENYKSDCIGGFSLKAFGEKECFQDNFKK